MQRVWSPRQYRRTAAFVSEMGEPVLDWLAPQPGERILDLGCGDGVLTAKIAARGCAVVGVDASPEMAAAARSLGLDIRLLPAEELRFDCEFDAVFTNAALHWMRGTAQVLANVYRALRHGGRFAGEMGGAGNLAAIYGELDRTLRQYAPSSPHPASEKYFPQPEEFRLRLERAGFVVRRVEHFPRPTPLPFGVRAWLETFAGEWLALIPPPLCETALGEMEDRLRPQLYVEGQGWHADYIRLRFLAVK